MEKVLAANGAPGYPILTVEMEPFAVVENAASKPGATAGASTSFPLI